MSEIRLKKIESLLTSEISTLIRQNIKDPRVNSMATVTHLTVSKDIKHAKVYISMFGENDMRRQCVEALNHAAGFIQKSLGKRLRLKSIPKLVFYDDHSIEEGIYITQRIKEILS